MDLIEKNMRNEILISEKEIYIEILKFLNKTMAKKKCLEDFKNEGKNEKN